MDQRDVSYRARRLRDLTEPLAASVYFAPECHTNYEGLGFGPSSGAFNGVAGPNFEAYFVSRGACLGRAPGQVITAAFGVFNPELVVPTVTSAWTKAGPEALLQARLDGQRAQLVRLLGEAPAGIERATELYLRAADALPLSGRALFSGLRAVGLAGDPVGDLWRAADMVREGRGDSHIAAWLANGLGPVEVSVLTELWWGLPHKSYSRTRGWTDAHLDAAAELLRSAGYLDGAELTPAGRELRRRIELDTDRQDEPMIRALGDHIDELFTIVEPWRDAILAGFGYPATAFQTAADL
jgi:hypothetical protein